jgi:hypothetical protein
MLYGLEQHPQAWLMVAIIAIAGQTEQPVLMAQWVEPAKLEVHGRFSLEPHLAIPPMPDYIALKTNQNRKGAGYKPALSNIEYWD